MESNISLWLLLLVSSFPIWSAHCRLLFEEREFNHFNDDKFQLGKQKQLIEHNLLGKNNHNKLTRIKRFPIHLEPNAVAILRRLWIESGECPLTSDGKKEYFCPNPTESSKWICIDDFQLCDGVKHCPNAEDEDPHNCLFYKAVQSQLGMLINGFTGNPQDLGKITKQEFYHRKHNRNMEVNQQKQ